MKRSRLKYDLPLPPREGAHHAGDDLGVTTIYGRAMCYEALGPFDD